MRWQPGQLLAVDFYDPARHTEVSIRRARRAYPPLAGTLAARTHALPLPTAAATTVVFLTAHEVREAAERAAFFAELRRITQPEGAIIVVEHLRDAANFLAYTIGFLHFHSRRAWLPFGGPGCGWRTKAMLRPLSPLLCSMPMRLQLEFIGALLVVLALLHGGFARYFGGRREFAPVSLINRQMMYVHTFFIALAVLLMGLLCLTSAAGLVGTALGRRVTLGLGVFWPARLLVQFLAIRPRCGAASASKRLSTCFSVYCGRI